MQKYRDEIMPDGPHIQEPPLMEWSAALYLAASFVEGRCHGQSDSDPAATSGAPFPLRLISRAEERAQREGPAPPATPQSPLPRVRPRLPPTPMAGEPRSQMDATAVEAHQEQAVPVPRSPRVRSTEDPENPDPPPSISSILGPFTYHNPPWKDDWEALYKQADESAEGYAKRVTDTYYVRFHLPRVDGLRVRQPPSADRVKAVLEWDPTGLEPRSEAHRNYLRVIVEPAHMPFNLLRDLAILRDRLLPTRENGLPDRRRQRKARLIPWFENNPPPPSAPSSPPSSPIPEPVELEAAAVSTAATLDASPVGNADGEAYVLFRLAIHAVAEGNLSLNLLNRLLYSAGSTQIKTATQAAARAALRVIATDDDAEICWQEEGASYRSFSRWRTYFEGRLRAYDAAIYPNGRQLTADDASASASTVPSDPAGAPISSTSLIGISDDMMAHLPPHLAKEIVAGAALLSLAEAPLHPDLSPDTSAADAVEGNDTSSHDPAVAEQECAESLAASLQRQQHQRAAMDWDTAGSRLPGEDLATLAQRVRDAFVKTINKFSAEAKAEEAAENAVAREAASRTSEELTLNPAWVEQQTTTFSSNRGTNLPLLERRLTHNEDELPRPPDGMPWFAVESAVVELGMADNRLPGYTADQQAENAELRRALKAALEQYEVAKEASYVATEYRDECARKWKYAQNGNDAAFTDVLSARPVSPSFSSEWPVTLLRMRQRHHDAFKEFAHATVDERLAYNAVAHLLYRYRRVTNTCSLYRGRLGFPEQLLKDDREALIKFREILPLGPHATDRPLYLPHPVPIRAPTAQGDAGGRALEAQCESCGQWTYLTCGDLTRERASCVATEPAQRILNDLTRSSACRLTHYCDEICQEYDQIAHHHRTGGVCGSRRTPFAGAEA